MLCLPQVGAFPLLLSYPCWLSHNLCNWHCSGLAMPSVPSPTENWLPHSDSLLVTPPASPPPPGFPPLPPGFYHSRPPRGLPRYPCSICSLDVGKDSSKCSTCSKWVHFSCSSLTRADFRKICAAGSPMGWNCPACLNGVLVSPTHRPASPRLVSPALPPPPPTPLACSDLMDSSLPLPSHPPLLNTCPPSAFTLPASSPQLHSRSTTCHRILKEIHASHTISEFCNGMPAVFPPPAVLNWSPFFLATTMTSFCSGNPSFVNQNVPNSWLLYPPHGPDFR